MVLLGLVYVAIYLFVLLAKTKLSKLIIFDNTYFGTSGAIEFRRLEGMVPPGRNQIWIFPTKFHGVGLIHGVLKR